jgi:hypothetical protein
MLELLELIILWIKKKTSKRAYNEMDLKYQKAARGRKVTKILEVLKKPLN